MKFLLTGIAAAGLSIATYMAMTGPEASRQVTPLATVSSGEEQFLLHVNGRASGCTLTRAKGGSGLSASDGCGDLHPPMAHAAHWIKGGDGSVIIAAADGEPLVELAVSDGAAYESFSPPTPFILLAPTD